MKTSEKRQCPQCGKNALWYTHHNNFGYCFYCGYREKNKKGAFIPLPPDPKLNEAYLLANAIFRQSLNKDALTFLHRRGIKDETIEEFSIGFSPEQIPVSDALISTRLVTPGGKSVFGNRVTFPYMVGNVITDFSARTVVNEEPKYKTAPGSFYEKNAVYPYNFFRALDRAQKTGYIILTEGIIKAVVGHQYGFPVCALNGITAIRLGFPHTPGIQWYVAFDSQRQGMQQIVRAVFHVSEYIRNVKVVILPLLGETKMDIDALLNKPGGDELFERCLQSAVTVDEYVRLFRL